MSLYAAHSLANGVGNFTASHFQWCKAQGISGYIDMYLMKHPYHKRGLLPILMAILPRLPLLLARFASSINI